MRFMITQVVMAGLVLAQTVFCAPLSRRSEPPVVDTVLQRQPQQLLSRDSAGSPPYFAVYGDDPAGEQGPPKDTSKIAGFNIYIAGFFTSNNGPEDKAADWQDMSDRQSVLDSYHQAGIKVFVSVCGGDDPFCGGTSPPYPRKWVDPTQFAQKVATYVQKYNLDGVDLDYEDTKALQLKEGDPTNAVWNGAPAGETGATWLTKFTTELRNQIGSGKLISHAPQAPYFSPEYNSGYLQVNSKIGSVIDFYIVQYYNQGDFYNQCDQLLNNADAQFPGTAIRQLQAAGIPLNKVVVGKPAIQSTSGYMAPTDLASCLSQIKDIAGIATWQYPTANAEWIKDARGSAWPVARRSTPEVQSDVAARDKTVTITQTVTVTSTATPISLPTPRSEHNVGYNPMNRRAKEHADAKMRKRESRKRGMKRRIIWED